MRLQKLGMDSGTIEKTMQGGNLDVLRPTKRRDMRRTIEKLRSGLDGDQKEKWDEFFVYFDRILLNGLIPFYVWNTSSLEAEACIRLVSTNNALENFNRQLNESFPTAHPNIYLFVEVKRQYL